MSAIAALAQALGRRTPRTVIDRARSEAGVAVILVSGRDELLLIRRAGNPRFVALSLAY